MLTAITNHKLKVLSRTFLKAMIIMIINQDHLPTKFPMAVEKINDCAVNFGTNLILIQEQEKYYFS